ncbi:DUF4183 domain-containing protein [Salipaludibacillus sp. LMS25]|jgi:hypothetical protein|uniref:DUF4183 domain-containing protein n=1 Tax=Salipaludibacillus sp. LMS25 TaxID=2924031 RepID=UPI0020D1E89E|nr:DUF4183 domain-containing protein [Salipaludibacillus sp. LMS25]UTR14756.1 DUF4183 domain-containing protein [Salipaludibacillus sp. LMS25]
MAIIKPFLDTQRFAATIGDGTPDDDNVDFVFADTTPDAGLTAFPTVFASYNLYVNGVLQLDAESTFDGTTLTIIDGNLQNAGVPITIEFLVN